MVAFVATQIVADIKPMPGPWTVKQYVIAHRDFMQLWPAIELPRMKPVAWIASSTPSLSKSANRDSHPQPLRETPRSSLRSP